jgi:dephospho-CoA kinase
MARMGGHVVRADQFGHDALRDPEIRATLIERWGPSILNPNGDVDRKAVGRIVFADPAELRALEAFVFPFIEKRILEEITRARGRGDVQFIVLDAAIMFETGWHRHCEKVIFVDAPRGVRLARVKAARGWDEKELDRRESMQLPLEEKKNRADLVIVNDAEPEKVVRPLQDALVRWKMI